MKCPLQSLRQSFAALGIAFWYCGDGKNSVNSMLITIVIKPMIIFVGMLVIFVVSMIFVGMLVIFVVSMMVIIMSN